MLPWKIHPGDDAPTKAYWEQDALGECYNDDALWGYAIRSAKVLARERTQLNDPVLYRLLHMGVFD